MQKTQVKKYPKNTLYCYKKRTYFSALSIIKYLCKKYLLRSFSKIWQALWDSCCKNNCASLSDRSGFGFFCVLFCLVFSQDHRMHNEKTLAFSWKSTDMYQVKGREGAINKRYESGKRIFEAGPWSMEVKYNVSLTDTHKWCNSTTKPNIPWHRTR